MKIYGDINSGNCYKIKLLVELLGIEHEWIIVDVLSGETKTDTFLQKNPNGQIPTVELDSGEFLAESNAILYYLSQDTSYFPSEKLAQTRVLQWQFFEQYSHEPYVAVARFIALYLGLPEDRIEEYKAKQEGGHKALSVMEQQLSKTPFLAGDECTIADISLYGYTHVAHEGGFDLSDYPKIQAWLKRIEALPGYFPMKD